MKKVRLRDVADSFLVCREGLHVVHVGLPVLDDALVISRHHPLIVVTPYHRTDGRIVRLQNCFEVEGEAVPERELAARRSCDQSPSLWRPLQSSKRAQVKKQDTTTTTTTRTEELGESVPRHS